MQNFLMGNRQRPLQMERDDSSMLFEHAHEKGIR